MTYLDHITVEHKEILRAEIRPSVKKMCNTKLLFSYFCNGLVFRIQIVNFFTKLPVQFVQYYCITNIHVFPLKEDNKDKLVLVKEFSPKGKGAQYQIETKQNIF